MRYLLAFLLLLLGAPALAQDIYESGQHNFKIVTVAENLEHPWAVDFLPGGEMLVTERPGRLNIIGPDGRRQKVSGLPEIAAEGQGGLLDVLVHPDFQNNRTIFFAYSAGDALEGLGTEVARARLDIENAALEGLNIIFKARPKIRFGANHFGARLLIGPDEKLYITLGERFRKDQAQEYSNHLGSIIRLNQDGSAPGDNPFMGKEDYAPEIYTYGNRNVQGIAVRPATGEIWFHEHGPRGGDELNILKAGANYGWPEITYGIGYSGLPVSDKTRAPGMEQPVVYWDPSIAPSGMTFYEGDKFPHWRGDIFLGALAHRHLRRLELEGQDVVEQEILLKDMNERIRDVVTGPDGFLYIVTDSPEGRVLRLEPSS